MKMVKFLLHDFGHCPRQLRVLDIGEQEIHRHARSLFLAMRMVDQQQVEVLPDLREPASGCWRRETKHSGAVCPSPLYFRTRPRPVKRPLYRRGRGCNPLSILVSCSRSRFPTAAPRNFQARSRSKRSPPPSVRGSSKRQLPPKWTEKSSASITSCRLTAKSKSAFSRQRTPKL